MREPEAIRRRIGSLVFSYCIGADPYESIRETSRHTWDLVHF